MIKMLEGESGEFTLLWEWQGTEKWNRLVRLGYLIFLLKEDLEKMSFSWKSLNSKNFYLMDLNDIRIYDQQRLQKKRDEGSQSLKLENELYERFIGYSMI